MDTRTLFKTLPFVLVTLLIVACDGQQPSALEESDPDISGEKATPPAAASPTPADPLPAVLTPSATAATDMATAAKDAAAAPTESSPTPAQDLAPTATLVGQTPTATADNSQAEIDPTASFTPQPPPTATPTATWTPTATQPQPAVACPDDWFMNDPPEVCPDGPPLSSYAAAQRFERGWLIWVEESDTFYILFNLGAHPFDSRLAFQSLGPLVFRPGASVDNRVEETPPDGLMEPVSGFGLIWRGEVEGLEIDLRQALGWAVVPESGFQTMIQCERQQTYSARTCYLDHIDGSVIILAYHAIVGNVWSRR